jgi:hypothetical protein
MLVFLPARSTGYLLLLYAVLFLAQGRFLRKFQKMPRRYADIQHFSFVCFSFLGSAAPAQKRARGKISHFYDETWPFFWYTGKRLWGILRPPSAWRRERKQKKKEGSHVEP